MDRDCLGRRRPLERVDEVALDEPDGLVDLELGRRGRNRLHQVRGARRRVAHDRPAAAVARRAERRDRRRARVVLRGLAAARVEREAAAEAAEPRAVVRRVVHRAARLERSFVERVERTVRRRVVRRKWSAASHPTTRRERSAA